ncbi:tetratricopeptide repeat protein [Planctomycetales bacterium ZRK34]|nr:tetratricopeptide repeat protein [Planctomycetales bacterium ZRK34]
MAGKVNTNFVAILAAVLVAVTAVLVGAWYFATRHDPAEYIARGDVMMQSGNYEQAAQNYGRAYREDSTSPLIMLKYTEAVAKIPAETTQAMTDRVKQILSFWEKIISVAPTSPQAIEAQDRLMNYYHDAAGMFGSDRYWTHLYNTADDIVNNVNTTDTAKAQARKYRGLSLVNRMGRMEVDQATRDQALEDLTAAYEAEPDDPELPYALAQWKLHEAQNVRRSSNDQKADALADEAVAVVSQFAEAHPESAAAKLNLVRILLVSRQTDQAKALLQELEQHIGETDDIDLGLQVANYLVMLDREPVADEAGRTRTINGRLREEKILRQLLANHPDSVRLQYELADNLINQARRAEAAPLLLGAIEQRPATANIRDQRDSYLQLVAIDKLADLYLAQREASADVRQRDDLLAKTEQLLEQMRQRTDESAMQLDLLEGKIAMAKGDFITADQKLNAASEKASNNRPEILILQARALRQLGQLGAARDRLTMALNLPAGRRYWPVYRELATLELKLNRPDQAMTHIQHVLDAVPGDTEALQLKASIMAQQFSELAKQNSSQAAGKLKDAIAILETLPNADERPVRLQLAQLYQAMGRSEEVRNLLEPLLKENPKDFLALRELLRSDLAEGRKDEAAARIDQALTVQDDPKTVKALKMMRDQLTGQSTGTVGGQIEDLLATEQDPFQRAIWMYSYHAQAGDQAKADAALAEAEKMKPDDPAVLRAKLTRAMAHRDWPEAERIAERAGKLDLDDAQGMFWIGEVELQRARYTQAVATLNRGVSLRPRYSDGWRLLGQARLESGDLVGAEAALKRALELRPNNVDALKIQYRLHDKRGNEQLALQTLEQAVEFAPRDRALYEAYLNYLTEHGQADRALKLRERMAEVAPNDQTNRRALAALYERLGQSDKAQQQLDQLMQSGSNSLANIRAMAEYHRHRGQIQEGQKLLVDYIGQRGDKVTAEDWLVLARYLREADRAEQAEAAYRRAIAIEDETVMPATRELGDWMFAHEQHLKAAELYERLLTVTREPRVARRYIETLVRSGQFEKGHEQLKRFVTEHGQDVQTALLEGLILSNLGAEHRDDAERAYDRAVQLGDGNAQAHLYRARFHFNSDDPATQAQVRSDLQRAIVLDPSLLTARKMLISYYLDPRRNDAQSAIDEFVRAIDQSPASVDLRVALAQLYLQQKRYTDMDRLLDESVKLLPGQANWRQLRAASYTQQGQSDRAIVELAAAYKQQPSAVTLTQYANALLDAKRYTDAMGVLDEHAEVTAKVALLQAQRARALAGTDRHDMAVASFNKALDLAAGDMAGINRVVDQLRAAFSEDQMLSLLDQRAAADKTGLTSLIVAQTLAEKAQYSQAVERLIQLRQQLEPASPMHRAAMQLLATAYYQMQLYDKAWPVYEALLKVQPNDVSVLNNAAYLLAENLNQPGKALPLAERAAELAPKQALAQASILDTLGWVQFRNGSVDRAELTLRRSIQLHPLAPVHLHLARVLIKKQQTDAARQQINAARRLAEETHDDDMIKQAGDLLEKIDHSAAQGAATP